MHVHTGRILLKRERDERDVGGGVKRRGEREREGEEKMEGREGGGGIYRQQVMGCPH